MLDPAIVKSLRIARSWSQEQLADVSGLSLRTIQRTEKRGNASLETKMALASVFEVDAAALELAPAEAQKEAQRQQINRAALIYGAAGGVAALVLGLLGGVLGLTQGLIGSGSWGSIGGAVGLAGALIGLVFALLAARATRAKHPRMVSDETVEEGPEA